MWGKYQLNGYLISDKTDVKKEVSLGIKGHR